MQTDVFYVRGIKDLKTNKGDPYLILDLINRDKVRVRGVVWNPNDVTEDDNGCIKENKCYIFDAEETNYRGELQLNISWAEKMDNVDVSGFINSNTIDIIALKKRLLSILGTIRVPAYRYVVKSILSLDNGVIFNKLQNISKTVNYDYSYPGGLLKNIVYQVELADKVALTLLESEDSFEESRDLLVCAAFVCDLGKIKEIDDFSKITDDGELLGHQYLGCLFLSELDESSEYKYHEQITKLKHCVLAHHSTDYNNWTAVKIKLKEAELLRQITHLVFRSEEWDIKHK